MLPQPSPTSPGRNRIARRIAGWLGLVAGFVLLAYGMIVTFSAARSLGDPLMQILVLGIGFAVLALACGFLWERGARMAGIGWEDQEQTSEDNQKV
jgi:low affinity Fe/Cu permease